MGGVTWFFLYMSGIEFLNCVLVVEIHSKVRSHGVKPAIFRKLVNRLYPISDNLHTSV